ncbi:MAG: hypothetical protein H8E14_11940 [Candidatus Marinimicrobia bacterium]|nr:hypothetical protein [Candidatus Neomarinimicrobiota bacterium]
MGRYKLRIIILLSGLLLLLNACSTKSRSEVNLDHALSLIDSVEVDGQILTYLWIYAEAPDYQTIPAQGEGVTCVDDVGRFMEVLERSILEYDRTDLLPIARGMTKFLLYLARDDGLWYNFMETDGTINTTHKNSQAEFGWWAIRGLRGLAAAYNLFHELNLYDALQAEIALKVNAATVHIDKVLNHYSQYKSSLLGKRPAWLVHGAPDKSSELVLALTKLHQTGEFDFFTEIKQLSQGLVASQFRLPGHELNGMYFCWENIWHGWGNTQAYALMEAYRITGDIVFLKSVRLWADNFASYLIDNQFPRRITVNSDYTYSVAEFPQIAYGINSSYQGLKALWNVTQEQKYLIQADRIYDWFSGNNVTGQKLYDPRTGRCFDGIIAPADINRNSGAESTIECLLAALEKYTN